MSSAAELLYNLVALALVGALAYFFPWVFLLVIGTSVLVSLSLMVVERLNR